MVAEMDEGGMEVGKRSEFDGSSFKLENLKKIYLNE